MSEKGTSTSIDTRLSVVEERQDQFHKIAERQEDTIEILRELTSGVKTIAALHEQRIVEFAARADRTDDRVSSVEMHVHAIQLRQATDEGVEIGNQNKNSWLTTVVQTLIAFAALFVSCIAAINWDKIKALFK